MTANTSQSSGQTSGQPKPRRLGELRRIPDFDPRGASCSVKGEIRRNLLRALEKGETLFPGVHGYEDTVVPQIVNALLSRHNFILLGLRGQAKRGIFAINELPDLAGKIQVGLFNIMQEGDIQIKGYPLRLPLDVLLVFTANPEDYTARGKIITPLKDRIGAEIRTHYPSTLEEGMRITAQEAWVGRDSNRKLEVPAYLREVVEEIAFQAREDKRVDRRSGVSQRLPITTLESVVSSAEQRAARIGEKHAVARAADVYAALPAITGKMELEYEGELKGADIIARELIRTAFGRVFSKHFTDVNFQPVIQWFELGGELKLPELATASERCQQLCKIQGLMEHIARLGAHDRKEIGRASCRERV